MTDGSTFRPGPTPGYRPCVGVTLFDRNGRVFVAERLDRPGAWQMPQGGIDAGEDPLAAARRELHEETSIASTEFLAESALWRDYDLPADLRMRMWGGRFKGQTQRWFAFRFLGADSEIDLATAHPEFARWRWAALTDVPLLAVPFKRETYEQIVAEFGHLAR
jgi:putative (di)nucleoside polyphosphate hydrolase